MELKSNATEDRTGLIRQVLTSERVVCLTERNKAAALEAMIELLATSPSIESKDKLVKAVFQREALMSTGIGLGLAVPHVRIDSVRDVVMAVGISRDGISDYASLDDKPVQLIFLIAAPEGQHAAYLRLLSTISLRTKQLGERLMACENTNALYAMLVGDDAECSSHGPEEAL